MEDIQIRKAENFDIEQLIILRQKQLLEEGAVPKEDISLNLKEYFILSMTENTFVSWLAISNNRIIATSGITFYQIPPNYYNPKGYIGHVSNMYTLEPYRRKGIAFKLLAKVIDEAKQRGINIIRLTASKTGEFLYKSFGFSKKDNFYELKI